LNTLARESGIRTIRRQRQAASTENEFRLSDFAAIRSEEAPANYGIPICVTWTHHATYVLLNMYYYYEHWRYVESFNSNRKIASHSVGDTDNDYRIV